MTRPKFWPRPRLFIQDKFFRYQYRDFFSETKFSETDTETFFPSPNFPIMIPRLLKNWQKSRDWEVTLWWCEKAKFGVSSLVIFFNFSAFFFFLGEINPSTQWWVEACTLGRWESQVWGRLACCLGSLAHPHNGIGQIRPKIWRLHFSPGRQITDTF